MLVLETQDLLDVLDLNVFGDLVVARLTDIEELSAEREHTKPVTTLNGTET